ncbi:MAG TPA: hypothetical protein VKE41_19685 [Roseiflexaceae bacterium]|nr:hypothetical protein [Roseiflexaceae bacterium]
MADVIVSLECAMLRVKNQIPGIEPEPFQEAHTFAKVTYQIKDMQQARSAPGTPVFGIQRIGKGKTTRYILFRDPGVLSFTHEKDTSLQPLQTILKVQHTRSGANPRTAVIAYPVTIKDFGSGSLDTISWKLLLKSEQQGGAQALHLYYVRTQGSESGDPCKTPGLDCQQPATEEDLSVCLSNGC